MTVAVAGSLSCGTVSRRARTVAGRADGNSDGSCVMSVNLPASPPARGADAAVVRTVDIDGLSSVRYVHASALKRDASTVLSDAEIAAFAAHVYSQPYTDSLTRQDLLGAFLGPELVGTAGWSVADDQGSAARIRSVFVLPMFSGLGLGSRLLAQAETRAVVAGFPVLLVRATLNAVSFFEARGYAVTSQGVHALPGGVGLPVAFMRKVVADAGGGAGDDEPAQQGSAAH